MGQRKSFFISLKTTPEKTKRFLYYNAHVPGITLSYGVNGKEFVAKGKPPEDIVEPGCQWTPGAIGSGLSHAFLWLQAAKGNEPYFIFEDDAFLCKNFVTESERIINNLPEDWDIILWGNNLDTTLQFDLIPGVTQCVSFFSQDSAVETIDVFCKRKMQARSYPLVQTLGICGYAISSKGAKTLIETCLPFRSIPMFYPGLQRSLEATSIDHLMNHVYPNIKAYTVIPPLCLTDNDNSKSGTIR